MKSNDPLLPVRREVGSSSYLKTLTGSRKPDGPTSSARSLRFENLEDRRVLSATGFDHISDTLDNSAYVTSAEDQNFGFQQDEVVSYLKLLVNGEERQLTHADNVLTLVAGDTVEVVEIGFHSEAQEGVFAAEGYVNKIGDLTSASLIDYNDGRFSEREDNAAATGGEGVIAGLNNSWTVEAGWDRLTINLMHYTETATQVEGRFFVNMQVGEPDFAFDTDTLDKITEQEITVGDEVVIPGGWFNSQAGLFHNYGEVDIYHDCDPNTILWAGALVGNAGDSVEGEFLNTRTNDPFTERWIPNAPGEYILKYYVDPEDISAESNEDNNTYEIRLTVKEAFTPAPIAVDDTFDAGQSLDVLENDLPTEAGQSLYSEDFESSETLTWTTNPDGTDTATTGAWEATDPVGTAWNGVQLQLDQAGQGSQAFVTGGEDDGTVGLDDVDGGLTSATSELISIPSDVESTLSFRYNFAHLDNSSTDDFFRVSVIGENTTEVVLEERGASVDRAGEWIDFSADLTSFAGENIQLMVEAADMGSGSLVEAGIDAIAVTTADTPIKINEYSQGEYGTVALNDDGTFNYTAEAGFSGQDSFTYNLTDGENVSNTATVNVNVEAPKFEVETQSTGDEDTAIELVVNTQFEAVKVGNVPTDAFLNRGESIGNGEYIVQSAELSGLTVTPSEHSDDDFTLVVTPVDNGSFVDQLATKVQVNVTPVVDGGEVEFAQLGILTGTSGDLPVDSKFFDLDGSESHAITLSGLPSFVKLSAGEFDGTNWIVDSADLDGLQVSATETSDTTGWTNYRGRYLFQNWNVNYSVESSEADSAQSVVSETDTFLFTTWQKRG